MLTSHYEAELSGCTANRQPGYARDDPGKENLLQAQKIWWSESGTEAETSMCFCTPSAANLLLDALISLYGSGVG